MKILGVCDVESPMVYSPRITERFKDVDLVVSCGDLPHHYLDYINTMLCKPFYYVNGNHVYKDAHDEHDPRGGMDLHTLARYDRGTGLLLAGLEGSLDYNRGPYQYSQSEMWSLAWRLGVSFFVNRMLYGRYLDVFISHAPPWQVHDEDDLAHQGFKAFRWIIKRFRPRLFLHGHVHIYRQDTPYMTRVDDTLVVNVFPYRVIDLD